MEAEPKTPKEQLGFFGPGWWLPWIGVVALPVFGQLGRRLGKDLHFSGDSPGGSPPWYFIRHDFLSGTSFGLGLALCLAIAWLARRRYPENARFLVWFSVLWSGGAVWKALVIWFSGRQLMNPELATTRWPSFDAYLDDPVIWAGQIAVFVLVIAIARPAKTWRRLTRGSS